MYNLRHLIQTFSGFQKTQFNSTTIGIRTHGLSNINERVKQCNHLIGILNMGRWPRSFLQIITFPRKISTDNLAVITIRTRIVGVIGKRADHLTTSTTTTTSLNQS